MLKIGNITLEIPVVQAPLSGYSDRAMRALALEYGAELTYAGLMLDTSASHPRVIKKITFQPGPDEHPVGAQIHGTNPATMARAARMLQDAGYDLIDLNFACPARKVLARGRGGAMMGKPELVIDIYRRVRESVKCPLGVKIRTGYDDSQQSKDNFWQICQSVVAEGVDYITVHGRVVSQKYRGKADWETIKQVKQRFPQTIIFGSGDLFEPYDCVEKLKSSGIDGLSVARGAIGNPWIFRDIKAIMQGKPLPAKPDLAEQGRIIKKHIDMIFALYYKGKSVGYFRKFAAKYCLLHPERKKAASEIMVAKTPAELYSSLKKWYPIED
jgi:nifR3 family TIM-barrel protein